MEHDTVGKLDEVQHWRWVRLWLWMRLWLWLWLWMWLWLRVRCHEPPGYPDPNTLLAVHPGSAYVQFSSSWSLVTCTPSGHQAPSATGGEMQAPREKETGCAGERKEGAKREEKAAWEARGLWGGSGHRWKEGQEKARGTGATGQEPHGASARDRHRGSICGIQWSCLEAIFRNAPCPHVYTFAQMLAAETTGNRLSAFLVTVNLMRPWKALVR